jgi:hypothetical protein
MSLELVNLAASPKAAKKRAALISAEERVSLIDSEGEPSEPIGSARTNGSSHTAGGGEPSAVSESWIYSLLQMSLLAVLTGTTPNHQDPSTKTKRRRRKKKPTTSEEEEFVSLLGGGDGTPTTHKNNRRGKRPQPPVTLQEHYEEFRREWSVCRMIRYFLLMLSSASVTYWIVHKDAKTLHWEHYKQLLVPPVPQAQRCHAINKNEVPTTNNNNLVGCQCPDPDVPLPQTITSGISTDPKGGDTSTGTATATPRILKPWKQQHDRMVAAAQSASNVELDMVMIGDSIIERWNGTRHMGSEVIPGLKQVFNQRFTKAGGGIYEGLALGCSGDMVRDS